MNDHGVANGVRAELEAAYARSGRAYMARDATGVMALVAPDFEQTMPDGQTLGRADAEALLHAWFATPDEVTDYAVEVVQVTPAEDGVAAVIVERVASRVPGPDGRTHERRQANTARATWVRSPGGWQIARCDYQSGTMTVDGRKVDPFAPVR